MQSYTRLNYNTAEITGVINGVNKAADIITLTMGGAGKNVLMADSDLYFSKDGVTVARTIKFQDPQEDIGAKLLINAANKTVEQCGDGTTLTSLLTKEFVNNMFTLSDPINDRIDLTQSLVQDTIKYIKSVATPVDNLDAIYKVALTSSKSERIANLIREIYRKTGFAASISVEKSKNFNYTYYEVTDGLTFDQGMVHPRFANQENGNCSFENPILLIENGTVAEIADYAEYIDAMHQSKQPLVIIAKGFSETFIRYALTNVQSSSVGLQLCLIKHPGFGDSVDQNLKDIKAFMTNGMVNKITVTPYQFTLYNNPNKSAIKRRVKTLTAQLENVTEDWEALELTRRIANLQRTSAIIYVGGITQKNLDEEFDRIEDAVGACKVSLKSGVVPGAGSCLVAYSDQHRETLPNWFYKILRAPAYKILSNANLTLEPTDRPFNVKTKMIDDTILDPAQVLINALENASALAELLINTGYTLYDVN